MLICASCGRLNPDGALCNVCAVALGAEAPASRVLTGDSVNVAEMLVRRDEGYILGEFPAEWGLLTKHVRAEFDTSQVLV
jgi:hypothetical protein